MMLFWTNRQRITKISDEVILQSNVIKWDLTDKYCFFFGYYITILIIYSTKKSDKKKLQVRINKKILNF